MDNKVLYLIIGVSGWLLKELWDWSKSRHSKVEMKVDQIITQLHDTKIEVKEELSQMKSVLLLTQSKYDLFNERLDSLMRIKDSFNNFNDRIKDLETNRRPDL